MNYVKKRSLFDKIQISNKKGVFMDLKKIIIDKLNAADEEKYSRYIEYIYVLICELLDD